MNLAEIRRRLPMYVKKGYSEGYDSVYVGGTAMGTLIKDCKVYYKALCHHEDIEYVRREKFLSFFTYTKLFTIDGFYRETFYELHGFKNDCK